MPGQNRSEFEHPLSSLKSVVVLIDASGTPPLDPQEVPVPRSRRHRFGSTNCTLVNHLTEKLFPSPLLFSPERFWLLPLVLTQRKQRQYFTCFLPRVKRIGVKDAVHSSK